MTILENLWHGNVHPVEEFLEVNAEYKNLLRLVGKKREKLEAMFTSEQAELFEKYCTAVNEMNSVSEIAAFKYGFNLAILLLTQTLG